MNNPFSGIMRVSERKHTFTKKLYARGNQASYSR